MHHGLATKQKRTVMFLHENAGNIGLRMDFFELLYKKVDCNIFSVAYRGYSDSEGTPNQDGIMLDAQAMVQFLKSNSQIDQTRVYLDGRSLGGAVGLHLSSLLCQQKSGSPYFRGLIIENTFTSISAMADSMFSFFKYIQNIKNAMIRLKWESVEEVPHIRTPIFFISGD